MSTFDTFLEDKVREFEDLWNRSAQNLITKEIPMTQEMQITAGLKLEAFLRTALLEAEQAGYARAMGEAQKQMYQALGEVCQYPQENSKAVLVNKADIRVWIHALTPTDNNKELKD